MNALRRVSKGIAKYKVLLLMVLILALGAVLVSADPLDAPLAASVTLDINTDDFITGINDWLVVALPIVAIGVGISGAFAIALFIGRMIINAFKGTV
jgi:hypothetical protein